MGKRKAFSTVKTSDDAMDITEIIVEPSFATISVLPATRGLGFGLSRRLKLLVTGRASSTNRLSDRLLGLHVLGGPCIVQDHRLRAARRCQDE